MKNHLLIVEDHQDIFENIERKISTAFSDMEIEVATNCDKAFKLILRNLTFYPFTLLILDLTFTGLHSNTILRRGGDLLSKLKEEKINIPAIVYSSHDDMPHIYPIINNYNPQAYVIKSNTSSKELLFAIEQILKNKSYFSGEVHRLQLKRFKYEHKLDKVDEQIIRFLPNANTIDCWDGKVLKSNVPISYKSIKNRIDLLCDKFEVENEKQLLLKLQKLALL